MSETLAQYKESVLTTVEADARRKSVEMIKEIIKENKKKIGGGKFKVSERKFADYAEQAWICGELSGIERVLRLIEADPDINTKDLVRGEIHLIVLYIYKLVLKRTEYVCKINFEDLICGSLSTEHILKERGVVIEKKDNNIFSCNEVSSAPRLDS